MDDSQPAPLAGADDDTTQGTGARPTRDEAEKAVRVLLRWAGDDPEREGLLDTPKRVARAYEEYFRGYGQDPYAILRRTFEETNGYDEMVVLRDIDFRSHCEHHVAPIVGRAHIGYLPDHRVIGISKLARVVDVYAPPPADSGEADRRDRRRHRGGPATARRGSRDRSGAPLHDDARRVQGGSPHGDEPDARHVSYGSEDPP